MGLGFIVTGKFAELEHPFAVAESVYVNEMGLLVIFTKFSLIIAVPVVAVLLIPNTLPLDQLMTLELTLAVGVYSSELPEQIEIGLKLLTITGIGFATTVIGVEVATGQFAATIATK